jgi:hypothetical protein
MATGIDSDGNKESALLVDPQVEIPTAGASATTGDLETKESIHVNSIEAIATVFLLLLVFMIALRYRPRAITISRLLYRSRATSRSRNPTGSRSSSVENGFFDYYSEAVQEVRMRQLDPFTHWLCRLMLRDQQNNNMYVAHLRSRLHPGLCSV